uniref:Uncharacterized protein n=1 Tax=Solanum lycopersicum TaxID=4081 RepID=A0A3Q7HAF0_SOLLC
MGMTVVPNEMNELVPIRPVIRLRVCMDCRNLNAWTEKDHFPIPFMDQILERLSGKNGIAFLMAFPATTKYLLPLRIKNRPLSLALMGRLHLNGCRLGYAMHHPLYSNTPQTKKHAHSWITSKQ